MDYLSQIPSHPSMEREDYILYQPGPLRHILLHDLASSSSVLSFLKMKGMTATIKNLSNTEFMSENGKIPVLAEVDSSTPLCGFSQVFWHVSRKLDIQPTLDELSYIDWIESKFLEAELYMCWCYEPVVNEYTYPRYTHDLPWPISTILFEQKRRKIKETVGSKFTSFDNFLEKFNQFLSLVNKKIGSGPYCLEGDQPSGADALIYGHTMAIWETKLHPMFVDAVNKQRRIEKLKDLINRNYPS